MRAVDYSVEVACPLSKAWQIFLDFNHWATRGGIYTGIKWVHGQPWHAHSRARLDMIWPAPAEITVKIMRYESEHCITALYHGNGITSSQTIEFHAVSADETHVLVHCEFTGEPFVQLGQDVGSVLQTVLKQTFADFGEACSGAVRDVAKTTKVTAMKPETTHRTTPAKHAKS